jgi:tetratricopeptide (TPR) repeat protein
MNSPVQGEDGANVQTEDSAPVRPQGASYAIQLALESKWEEAVSVNRAIIAHNGSDVDAWNRLGKALLELGRYRDAHEAYARSLEIDPVGTIAKRNLDRLSSMIDVEPRRPEGMTKASQDLFIEEIGKTGVTFLQGATRETVAKLTAGDQVYLKTGDGLIRVEDGQGEMLGSLEPKLALRLRRMIEGGNRYAAGVKSVTDNDVELIIKEIYRDPSQTRVSFPTTGGEGVRPYIKESLLRLADEDEEEIEEDTDNEDWEAESEPAESTVSFSFPAAIERDVDDDDEE